MEWYRRPLPWYWRLAARIFTTALTAAFAVIVTVIWIELGDGPASPLTRGLSGSWAKISSKFDGRLRAKFPLGSSVRDMGAELTGQGFVPDDWTFAAGKEHRAWRRESHFPCNTIAWVTWQADSEGLLTALRGSYDDAGCL